VDVASVHCSATSLDLELGHSCAERTRVEAKHFRGTLRTFYSPAGVFQSPNDVVALHCFQTLRRLPIPIYGLIKTIGELKNIALAVNYRTFDDIR